MIDVFGKKKSCTYIICTAPFGEWQREAQPSLLLPGEQGGQGRKRLKVLSMNGGSKYVN